jgi:hypothetical protein
MKTRHVSSMQDVAVYADPMHMSPFDDGVWHNRDARSLAPGSPFISPQTRQTTRSQAAFEDLNDSSSRKPFEMASENDTSPAEQTKVKTACLRCRGKKSRCSGQRPCGGCTNDDLDCVWGDDETEAKRRSRKSKSTESKRKNKSKDAPLQVRSACTCCQHRKAKCSGTRPACAYCVERHLSCTYSVAEGETRTNDLKRRLRESEIRVQAFGRILAVMREGNIYQATEVLTRLRMGESPRDILQSLPTSIASTSPNSEFGQLELDRRLSG